MLELSIDNGERATFDLVDSRHNNGLLRLRARFSGRDIVQVAILTTLHEKRVNAADRGLVETPRVVTELRRKLVCLVKNKSASHNHLEVREEPSMYCSKMFLT